MKKVFKTRKEIRLEKIKKAKEKYKLSRKFSSNEFQRLRQYTQVCLGRIYKQPFDCGSLKIGILK